MDSYHFEYWSGTCELYFQPYREDKEWCGIMLFGHGEDFEIHIYRRKDYFEIMVGDAWRGYKFLYDFPFKIEVDAEGEILNKDEIVDGILENIDFFDNLTIEVDYSNLRYNLRNLKPDIEITPEEWAEIEKENRTRTTLWQVGKLIPKKEE